MPRRPRISTAGLCFHVLNRAAKRVPLFECENDYEAFEKVLGEASMRIPVDVFSYCLMPNHWHLVISPREDGTLSRFMHWVTTTHARRWQSHRALDGQGAVYQGRFKAIAVKDDGHFLWVCRYVERNPLRGSLVTAAEEWRWSSLASRRSERVIQLAPWPVDRPADWISRVNTPQTTEEIERFRRAIRTGTPFGDHDWQQETRSKMGITCSGGRGRPRRMRSTVP
jgi:putative transposase